jgi:RimJ/RimL family protein N-acetyltransferase
MKLESSKKRWPWQRGRPQDNRDVRFTGRLVALRSKRPEDAAADYAWRTDTELAALDATSPLALTFREYERYYRDDLDFPSPWSVRFAIETLDGQHIGNCMYYDIDPERKQAEIGIMIGDREFWGKGYGSDAVRTLLEHIFTETPIDHVYLHTLVSNVRAQKAFTRAGLRVIGQVHRDGYEFMKMEARREDWECGQAPDNGSLPHSGSNGSAPAQG